VANDSKDDDPLLTQAEQICERLIGKPGMKPVKLHRWADIRHKVSPGREAGVADMRDEIVLATRRSLN